MKHKLNNKKKCPNCGLSMRESDQSCNECGYNERKKPKSKLLVDKKECSSCGAVLEKGNKVCDECGHDMTMEESILLYVKKFKKIGRAHV